ncbi:hypothetical protein, partial [Planktothrix sp. FACHB-1355]|uniref:hypothetical protein n=1 Tax=Planktothrix sp. FACHB-1355 TaxID=2692854 RepID=UPI001A7E5EE0
MITKLLTPAVLLRYKCTRHALCVRRSDEPAFLADAGKAFGRLAMRQVSFLTFVATLALLTGGCNFFGGGGGE